LDCRRACATRLLRAFSSDGLARDRLAFCSTHSHTAPHLTNLIPSLFGLELPADQAERIDRYTQKLIADAARAVHDALAATRPGTIAFTRGRAGFAANRRSAGGPVDHDVPVLVVRDAAGALVATLAAYACHCTTLAPSDDFVCGDWAGYASEILETTHVGAVALVAIGCGGDQNPAPRTGLDHAKAHGRELAAEIDRLAVSSAATPITAPPVVKYETIELSYATARTREQWLERKALGGPVGHHATHFLGMLDRGEAIPSTLSYPVQSFCFGDSLAMVFLAGEVVVDYALRLKRELRAERIFLAAYANDLPCYIPSRRVLDEGGYEAEGAMTYYGRPNRLSPSVEDDIVRAVRTQLPPAYALESSRADSPTLRSRSVAAISGGNLEMRDLRLTRGKRHAHGATEPVVQSR
jgi:hypothetical protein